MNRDQLNAQLSAEFGGPAIDAWPTVAGGRMRPHKGGGDGGAGEMRKQEEDRQARIKKSVDAINSIFNGQAVTEGANRATSFDPSATYYDADGNQFVAPTRTWMENAGGSYVAGGGDSGPGYWSGGQDVQRTGVDMDAVNKLLSEGKLFTNRTTTQPVSTNRTALYDEQKQAVTDLNRREVDRQYAEAERANRFGLARSGLLGGSADVDSNAELQRRTNEGTMQATAMGDQAAADLRTSDERTRQGLISMAQSGIDTGTAQQTALAGLNANSQAASAARGGATIGGLFNDLSQAYLANQVNAGRVAGSIPGQQQWYGVSSPQQSYGGSTTR